MGISYVGGAQASSTVGSISMAWPTGTSKPHDGDVAIIGWTFQNSATATIPSGWTVPTGGNQVWSTGNGHSVLMYRVCDGTESGNISMVDSTGADKATAVMGLYRGVDTSNPIDAFTSANNGASTTHAAASVTLGVANAGVLTIIGERSSTGTSSWTPPSSPFDNKRQEAATTGGGMTITALADDGMNQTRSAGASVSPGTWTSANSFSGNAWIWTVSLTPRADVAPYEIVTNGDFETNTTGWDSNSSWFTFDDGVESRITTDSFTGSACMKVTYTGATKSYVGVNWRTIDLDPDLTYYVSAAIKVVSGRRVFIRTRDWNGGTPVYANSGYVEVGAGWTWITYTFTSGSAADNSVNNLLSVVSEFNNGSITDGEFYVDTVHWGTFQGDQYLSITGATETDTAGSLSGYKTGSITGTAETDAAGSLSGAKTGTLTGTSETDTAGSLTASKTGTITGATETDAAGSLSGYKTGSITGTSETDSAATLSGTHVGTITGATETDAAGTLSASKTGTLTGATETDTAGSLTGSKTGTITGASETDAAGMLPHTGMIVGATETDAAGTLSASKTGTITGATETDTAGSLTASKTGTIVGATETDTASALFAGFQGVSETDTAGSLTASKTGTITGATETDTAGSLTGSKTGTITGASETDTAGSLMGQTIITITGASETDAAGTLTPKKVFALIAATETDAAGTLPNGSAIILPPLTVGAAYRVLFVGGLQMTLQVGRTSRTLFVSAPNRELEADKPYRVLFVGVPR